MQTPRRILLTGASGFVGRHLLPKLALAFPQATITGCSGPTGRDNPLDLRDYDQVTDIVARTLPDTILHLGGTAAVARANADPERTLAVNAAGTRNLFNAVENFAKNAFCVLISSSEVYGESLAGGRPTPETTPCHPLSPYAASKWAAEQAAQEAVARGLHVIIARPFNHTGPGQGTDFVVPAFASQIAAIVRGQQPPIVHVGWLEDVRDFTDVRDIVDGYIRLIQSGRDIEAGTAINFASGIGRPISTVLDLLRAQCAIPVEIEVDPLRLRPGRLPAMVGDAGLAVRTLSWRPLIPFEQTVADVLQGFLASNDVAI